ncbi:MAG: hypothetical protein ACLQM6_12415 [Acidobacteriaceae bacterium]
MPTDGHNKGNEAKGDTSPVHGAPVDAEHPGYETTDVNVRGVAIFLTGLFATVFVFFFLCFYMGRLFNAYWQNEDGPATKWQIASGAVPPTGKGKDLASNPEIEQKQLQQIVGTFPEPRLDMDDGNQATADLHAREDMLLEHYSLIDGQPGAIRIPIERAMELIVQRGLPVANPSAPADSVAHAAQPQIQAPLTTGFARTGFEQTVIEARRQKMIYGAAETSANAEATPPK